MTDILENFKTEQVANLRVRTWHQDDLGAISNFYDSFPDKETDLMRYDVKDKALVKARFKQMEDHNIDKIIAVDEDSGAIIGEATLQGMRMGWLRKAGEIRTRIHPDHRQTDLGNILTREMFLLAARRGMNNIVVKLLAEDKDMFAVLKKLGFKAEATQKNHVTDHKNRSHDIHHMTFSLAKMWRDLENSLRSVNSPSREH
jgi:RimJ/RimL family protein N-acetyltransferase